MGSFEAGVDAAFHNGSEKFRPARSYTFFQAQRVTQNGRGNLHNKDIEER